MNAPLHSLGKLLLVAGIGIAAIGLVLVVLAKTGWIPRVPGDLILKRKNVTVYLPIGTSILLSLLLTLLLWLINRR